MKQFFIFLCLCLVCFPMALKAGARSRVDACETPPCLRSPVVVVSNAFVSTKPTNTAFFNFEDSPRTPFVAQTRGGLMTPISILQTDMVALMMSGNYQRIRSNASSYTMNIGVADNVNPQTWTVPSPMIYTNRSIEYFIAPTSITPVSAQAAGATHVTRSAFLDDMNTLVTRYRHYQVIDGDELDEMGETYVKNGMTVGDYDEAAQIYTDAPLELGDVFTTDITEYEDDDNDLPRTETQSSIVVDAFGSIVTPLGTYNCLRLTITEIVEKYTNDPNVPSSTTTTYKVAWVTKEGYRLYMTKPSASASGLIIASNPSLYEIGLSSTLPIELLSFKGQYAPSLWGQGAGGSLLTWTTASEKNNAGFQIQRSGDGKNFSNIGFAKSDGDGNSPRQTTYNFVDNTPLSTATYYRLRQVDFDGKAALSNVIVLEGENTSKGLKVYPNPSNSNQITLEMDENWEVVIITNALGQIVFQQSPASVASSTILSVDVSNWMAGIYYAKSGAAFVKFMKN
jgi:Secretion system C-terminal sorting domain